MKKCLLLLCTACVSVAAAVAQTGGRDERRADRNVIAFSGGVAIGVGDIDMFGPFGYVEYARNVKGRFWAGGNSAGQIPVPPGRPSGPAVRFSVRDVSAFLRTRPLAPSGVVRHRVLGTPGGKAVAVVPGGCRSRTGHAPRTRSEGPRPGSLRDGTCGVGGASGPAFRYDLRAAAVRAFGLVAGGVDAAGSDYLRWQERAFGLD